MIEVKKTRVFRDRLASLLDPIAVKAIRRRLARVQIGLLGDVKPVGAGLSELRVDIGPGYRVYFTQRGPVVVLLLCDGDKQSQRRDIERARALAQEWSDGDAS